MKNNAELQKDVRDAIQWEPLLHNAEIGVTAKDGIVTLTGFVDCYAKKSDAENAAKKVGGVKVVIEKIIIKPENAFGKKNDNELAVAVVNALKWSRNIPKNKISIEVENGWVTLTGGLCWNYQKEAVKHLVKNLLYVKGITDNIIIEAETTDEIEKEEIEKALLRNWATNNRDIHVKVAGNNVILSGDVMSWHERGEAERMAWNSPGVFNVDNQLVIDYD